MAQAETLSQQVGRTIVASALSNPGEDVSWGPVYTAEDGRWLANAVEIASLEVRMPPQCTAAFSALKGGA